MITAMRAAAYFRVSTDDQWQSEGKRIEDSSLDVQKKRAIEHSKFLSISFNKQVEILYFIEDAGKSAKDTNRQGFKKLCSLIEQRQVDIVIAADLSRLSRNVYDYVTFKKLCEIHKVEISYVGEGPKEKDPIADLIDVVRAAVAQVERDTTAKKQRVNLISRLKTDGKINGAEPILGLDKCTKRRGHFVINHDEVKMLISLLEIFLDSSGEADAIRTAHMKGLRDKGDREFTKLRFKNILKNVKWRYAGKWYLQGTSTNDFAEVQLDHGEVISEDLRKRVLDRIKAQSLRNLKRGKHNHVYLLSKILKSSDGFNFSGQIGHGNTQDYRYYYCRESKLRVNSEVLEILIEKRVIRYFKDSSLFKKIISSGFDQRDERVEDLKKEILGLKNKIKDLDIQIYGLIKHMANPALTSAAVESIATQLNEFEAQKNGVLTLIQDKEHMAGYFLSLVEVTTAEDKIEKYAREFKNLSRTQKRELLESIFEKIEVMDPYLVKLHMKKPPKLEAFDQLPKKSCDYGLSGGTNRT